MYTRDSSTRTYRVRVYGCYNPKLRSGILNNSTKKYRVPLIKQGGNGAGPPNLHSATRNFRKNVKQVWKITNFDHQAALFNGASMEAIT